MVSTSGRKAGDPWFDSRSQHDRFCASVSICSFNILHRASLNFNQIIRCIISPLPHTTSPFKSPYHDKAENDMS